MYRSARAEGEPSLPNGPVTRWSIGRRGVPLVAAAAPGGSGSRTEGTRTGATQLFGQHGFQLEGWAQLHAKRVGQVFLGEQRKAGAVDALVTKVLNILCADVDTADKVANIVHRPGADLLDPGVTLPRQPQLQLHRIRRLAVGGARCR